MDEAIARLKAAGLLEIRERYYKQSRGKTATAFRLSAVNANVCSPVNRGSVQACTTMESRLSRIPDGRDQLSTQALSGQQAVSNPRASPTTVAGDEEWNEVAAWLARRGRYVERWGFGAESIAAEDLEKMRQSKGEAALRKAIGIAKDKNLYGEVLTDFLANTFPSRSLR